MPVGIHQWLHLDRIAILGCDRCLGIYLAAEIHIIFGTFQYYHYFFPLRTEDQITIT